MKRKTAIFGGSFDPIHLGHLRLALAAIRECSLDRLILMPNYISPFKTDRKHTSCEMRCEMAETLLHYDPALEVSRYEIRLHDLSYTYETLRHFRVRFGSAPAFIIGFDSVINIDTWYHGEDLIREFPLIAARRPDTEDGEAFEKIRTYRDLYDADITVLEVEPFDASSTQIRSAVREGKDVSALLPPEIIQYIEQHGLYKD